MTEAFGIRIDSPDFEAEINQALDYFESRDIDTQYKLLSRYPLAWSCNAPLDHLIIASTDQELGYPNVQMTEWLGKNIIETRTLQVL